MQQRWAIADLLNTQLRTGVFDICKRYAREGAAGLRDKPIGRAVNPRRALSEQQEVEIRALLRDQMSDQLKI
ncbi:MAG: hypothetical protein VB140_00275 [Burkholderia sp.]|nr:MAG: hypothetical protein E5299_00403 [Burkholderia gladioli]